MIKPAVFLDRDGVINFDKGYVYKIEDFEWINGAINAIKFLNKRDYLVFVVTNQSGIARGYYTEQDVNNLHNYINEELMKNNALINDFFYSPYHPDFPELYRDLSNLRKPDTGMLEMAEKKWNFEKSMSFLIGDKESDLLCAKKFGVKGYLFDQTNLLNFVRNLFLSE